MIYISRRKKQKIVTYLVPIILICLICGIIFIIKNTFSTQTFPKITIYKEIVSPDNKFIAVYYNIEDGMAVEDYGQICIRENNGTSLKATIEKDIDNFAPYVDRIFTI